MAHKSTEHSGTSWGDPVVEPQIGGEPEPISKADRQLKAGLLEGRDAVGHTTEALSADIKARAQQTKEAAQHAKETAAEKLEDVKISGTDMARRLPKPAWAAIGAAAGLLVGWLRFRPRKKKRDSE